MIILDRVRIEGLIDLLQAAPAIEAAYVAASEGRVTLPPVGYITFPDLTADCHIKYGHQLGDAQFVVRIATGFPKNELAGLPTGNRVSLVLSAQTGGVEAVLHDQMFMTDIRTGLGGAIATRNLARPDSQCILIVGTGPQVMRQIESHFALIDGVSFEVWGRTCTKAQALVEKMPERVSVAENLQDAAGRADVIVTATGSTQPLIQKDWVKAGTHITAVGADAPGKQELDTLLISRADVLVADSVEQCLEHGELSHAFASGMLSPANVRQVGDVLSDPDHNCRSYRYRSARHRHCWRYSRSIPQRTFFTELTRCLALEHHH